MATTDVDVSRETDVPDLIPARMLNEFCYCPRPAYLEWVQGEFADNLETLEGRFGHRRVDRPSRQEVPEAGVNADECGDGTTVPHPDPLHEGEGDGECLPRNVEKLHSRSVMFSAPGEGLIARIDVLDLEASAAVPVDYKRGKVPDVPGGAWEPEQVQLCAQGLILRENGYHCEAGILYFIDSRRRVSVPLDDALVERTRELLRQFRTTASSGTIPPPLDDSPKCPRCSLVGICLPDETRLLAESGRPLAKGEVRRLMPARDDALPLYIQEQGVTLGKSGDVLTIKRRREVLQQVKLLDVSQVCLLGNVQVTAQALREITAGGIPIAHFSYGGWFHALTSGLVHKNVELRMAQFAAAVDPRRSLRLARQFVVGKIKNSRTLLRRHLSGDRRVIHELADSVRKAKTARDPAALLGIEGMAAKEYFAGFARLVKEETPFNIEGRNRRPPRDPVNALLSFVYAMLTKELTVVLHAVGFDPMRGFFHQPRYGRPSLALDLAEEFRPLIGDSVALTLINNGEVTPASFIRRAGAVALTDAGRRAVIAAFERRMDTLVTHPIFGYRISYRRVLEVQARLLARALLGEIPRYASFCTR
jgi:CRISPR-associated protein Cas1